MQRYTVLSMGEAAGTAPEIIIKTTRALAENPSLRLIVTGDEGVFRKVASDLSLPLPFTYYAYDEETLNEGQKDDESLIFFVSSEIDMDKFEYGVESAETGEAAFKAVESAVSIIQNGDGFSLVTTPISGNALRMAGHKEDDIQSLLSLFAQSDRLVPMIRAGEMNIFGVTHRCSIREALDLVKRENIISEIVEIDSLMTSQYFDRSKPIAVASLNPMNPDGTWTGPDEADAIMPAIEIARSLGIDVIGPLQSEEIFSRGVNGEFSSIIIMTASTGYAAAAAAAPDKASYITWGLPFMHVHPLLDTGLLQAGKGQAGTERLEGAIALALLLRHTSYMA